MVLAEQEIEKISKTTFLLVDFLQKLVYFSPFSNKVHQHQHFVVLTIGAILVIARNIYFDGLENCNTLHLIYI